MLPLNVVLTIPFKFIILVWLALPILIIPALNDIVPKSDNCDVLIKGGETSTPASLVCIPAFDANILILDCPKLFVVSLMFLLLVVCFTLMSSNESMINVVIFCFKRVVPLTSKSFVISKFPCILLFPYAFNELQSKALANVVFTVVNEDV